MNEPTESLQIRLHGKATSPTLIYLPGIHGDWTLVRGFRDSLQGRLRFAEITYPRTLMWSLDEYAAAVEKKLEEVGIEGGWLLGESFGSQVVWAIAGRRRFNVRGIILAGGFVAYPVKPAVRVAKFTFGSLPLPMLRGIFRVYARVARIRYRNSPGTLESISEFIARRTKLDQQAIDHRFRLITGNDPRDVARQMDFPVYALSGLFDPIVPWLGVKPWLRKNCPGFRGSRVIWNADHNVLGTAPEKAVEQVLKWISPPH